MAARALAAAALAAADLAGALAAAALAVAALAVKVRPSDNSKPKPGLPSSSPSKSRIKGPNGSLITIANLSSIGTTSASCCSVRVDSIYLNCG